MTMTKDNFREQLGEIYHLDLITPDGFDVDARLFRLGNTWYLHNFFTDKVETFSTYEFIKYGDIRDWLIDNGCEIQFKLKVN